MSAIKFSQLKLLTNPTGEIFFPVVYNGTNWKLTLDSIKGSFAPSWTDLQNKPVFHETAISGDYTRLNNLPAIPSNTSQLTNGAGFITTASLTWNNITGKPNLFSGVYNDLSGKPNLFSGSYNDLTDKPQLFDGNYNSLSNRPEIPSNTNQLANGAGFITTASITWESLQSSVPLAMVAKTGSYTDLGNKPDQALNTNSNVTFSSITFPDASVQSTAFIPLTFITPDDISLSGITTIALTGTGVTASAVGNAITLDISGGGSGNVGDFTFVGGTASLPLGSTMTLQTYQNGGNRESVLTLAPIGDSALDVGGGLRVRTAYGTGFEKSWTFNTDGSITFPDATLQSTAFVGTGNIQFRNDTLNNLNGVIITNADQTTTATAQISVPANGSGSILITNNNTSWGFESNGNLSLPGDLTLPTGWRISSNQINTGLGTTVTSISLITESLSVDRRLEIYSESNRLHLDSHNPTTELYIGDNSQFIALQQSGEIFVSATGGLSLHGGGANSLARVVIPDQEDAPFTPLYVINTGTPGVIIQAGATPRNWQFRGSDGGLVFPDNTVQTTAWLGTADVVRNVTSLGGTVSIQTASQQGDPDKTWLFKHDGAGALVLTDGSTIRAKHGFNILATAPEFVNFTSIRNFDSLSFLDLTNIVIINPTASILAAIDPSTSTCVAVTGTTVRLMLDNGVVQNYQLTSTFVGEENNPFYGLPVWTATIPNSGIASTSIKEVSFGYSANWRFDTAGRITFPDGTTSTGATIFANSSSYKIQTISFAGSPSNLVSTYEFGVASITIPGNGIIYNEGQSGYWALDGVNGEFSFPNNSRISYGLNNAGLTEDDLKIQAINTGNVVVSANGADWIFGTDGSLTLPDSTVQTTAWTTTSNYTPATPSDWSGTPPTTIAEALDRLAARIKLIDGGIGA